MNTDHPATEDLLRRIRGEFAEMPGLRVTLAEAIRLWQLDPRACEALLAELVEQRSLTVTKTGAYVRSGN
jgi:hypothetical protein